MQEHKITYAYDKVTEDMHNIISEIGNLCYKLTDVDTKLIENATNSIGEDIEELLSISTTLSSSTMINLNPYWQGPAKESFEKQFTTFYESFTKYVAGHKALNEQLKSSGSTYGLADDSVKQMIARIQK